jgi:hypothetical protein
VMMIRLAACGRDASYSLGNRPRRSVWHSSEPATALAVVPLQQFWKVFLLRRWGRWFAQCPAAPDYDSDDVFGQR